MKFGTPPDLSCPTCCPPRTSMIKERRPALIVERLIHLTKYRNVLQIENPNPASKLTGQLILELLKPPPEQPAPTEGSSHSPSEPGQSARIKDGERLYFRIKNNSSQALWVT